MVEADSNLKLLPLSIFPIYIYTVFEHINLLSIGIQLQPYTNYPQLRIWGSGSLVESK